MDADLIAVARTLAERGWLPGIEVLPRKRPARRKGER